MIYHNKAALEQVRKNKFSSFYAVYFHLKLPVFKIDKITKKYVYWDDGTNHPYPSRSAGYCLFDSEKEAWKFYHYLYKKKENELKKNIEELKSSIEVSKNILAKKIKINPEYFI